MRDPSITRGPDGTWHLVWTSAWRGNNGFGYSHSKDLVHWSEQKFIPVMAHEPTVCNVWAPELFYDEKEKQFHHLLGLDDSRALSRLPRSRHE
jgi:beta-xylosidase